MRANDRDTAAQVFRRLAERIEQTDCAVEADITITSFAHLTMERFREAARRPWMYHNTEPNTTTIRVDI